MKKVIEQKEGKITIDKMETGTSLSQDGIMTWVEKENTREVALAICPELETEKIHFAVGFLHWFNKLRPSDKCTVHPPAGSGSGYGLYSKSDEQLILDYIKSCTETKQIK